MTDETDIISLEQSNGSCHVKLTHSALSITKIIDHVRRSKAGAIAMFAGTNQGV